MRTKPVRPALAFAVLAVVTAACPAMAADFQPPSAPGRLFRIVNASFDSVTAVEVANTNASGYEPIDLREPLQGGLTSTTVRLPDGTCLRDVRVTFRDGRSAVYHDIDVCRSDGLRLSAKRLPATH